MDHLIEQIKKEFMELDYPNEGCGLIIENNGQLEWIRSRNMSKDPENEFELDSVVFIQCMVQGKRVKYIVHSHSEGHENKLSKVDKRISDTLGISYLLINLPGGEIDVYEQ